MFVGDHYSGTGCHSRVAPSLRAAIPVAFCGRFLPQQRLHQWSASTNQSMQIKGVLSYLVDIPHLFSLTCASHTTRKLRPGDECEAWGQARDSAIEHEHCQMLSHEIMHIITHHIRYPTEIRQGNKPLSRLISQFIHIGMNTLNHANCSQSLVSH